MAEDVRRISDSGRDGSSLLPDRPIRPAFAACLGHFRYVFANPARLFVGFVCMHVFCFLCSISRSTITSAGSREVLPDRRWGKNGDLPVVATELPARCEVRKRVAVRNQAQECHRQKDAPVVTSDEVRRVMGK